MGNSLKKQPISCHLSPSVTPENIRKPNFLFFQGVLKETSGMKWFNIRYQNVQNYTITIIKTYTLWKILQPNLEVTKFCHYLQELSQTVLKNVSFRCSVLIPIELISCKRTAIFSLQKWVSGWLIIYSSYQKLHIDSLKFSFL